MIFKKFIFFLLFFLCSITHLAIAGGIKGVVKNTKGERLAYASISVKETSNGTIANDDGQYELTLNPGKYEIVFQYLNHKTIYKTVEIKNEFVIIDVVLEEVVINLKEVQVSNKNEDPAYSIMRKAISMARFHILEVDSYTARTYVKGTGKVKEISGVLKLLAGKKIEKETGLKVGQTYVMESINDVSFKQTNTIKEKVISRRSNFPKQVQQNGNAIMGFSTANFYSPKINDAISPLSPSAFAYYNFSYEGMFEDKGVQVNKIRVTPKSKGSNVSSGTINIIEDTWAIHSLDMKMSDENGKYYIKQLYSPFNDVWMPFYFEFGVEFDSFGINFGGRYITNVRNYDVKVNPKFHQQPVVIDEKIDKAEAKENKNSKINKKSDLTKQPLTRKQLKKIVNDLEKESKKERKANHEKIDLIEDYNISLDSTADKKNNDFWNTERQVPLTINESKGYAQADSIAKADQVNIRKDSLRNLPAFKFKHVFLGHSYRYGKKDPLYGYQSRLTYNSPLDAQNVIGNFYNSIEGYYLNAGLNFIKSKNQENKFEANSNFRYSFARSRLNGVLGISYSFNNLEDQISISGGRFVQQFNNQNPISPFMNTFFSLFLEKNYMKLYERTFANISYRKFLTEQFTFNTNFEFAQRNHLQNNHFTPLIDDKNRLYTSNDPVNIEKDSTNFNTHNTLLFNLELRIRPFAKAGKFNGHKYTINRNKPSFYLRSKMGLLDESKFTQLEFVYDQTWELEKLGDFRINAKLGTFINKPKYFIDYKHFNGNQTIFTLGNFESFRNLDYYTFSTAQDYLEIHANNSFQKFLLTQITILRLTGLKENVFANYLNTFGQGNIYVEVGYGLTGGSQFLGLGLEVVGSFLNEKYNSTVLRVKIPF